MQRDPEQSVASSPMTTRPVRRRSRNGTAPAGAGPSRQTPGGSAARNSMIPPYTDSQSSDETLSNQQNMETGVASPNAASHSTSHQTTTHQTPLPMIQIPSMGNQFHRAQSLETDQDTNGDPMPLANSQSIRGGDWQKSHQKALPASEIDQSNEVESSFAEQPSIRHETDSSLTSSTQARPAARIVPSDMERLGVGSIDGDSDSDFEEELEQLMTRQVSRTSEANLSIAIENNHLHSNADAKKEVVESVEKSKRYRRLAYDLLYQIVLTVALITIVLLAYGIMTGRFTRDGHNSEDGPTRGVEALEFDASEHLVMQPRQLERDSDSQSLNETQFEDASSGFVGPLNGVSDSNEIESTPSLVVPANYEESFPNGLYRSPNNH